MMKSPLEDCLDGGLAAYTFNELSSRQAAGSEIAGLGKRACGHFILPLAKADRHFQVHMLCMLATH